MRTLCVFTIGVGIALIPGCSTQSQSQKQPTTTPIPSQSNDLVVVSAVYGTETYYADVTNQVDDLLHHQDGGFLAKPEWLRADPAPSWDKTLVIVYESKGRRNVFTTSEGGRMSLEQLKLAKDWPIKVALKFVKVDSEEIHDENNSGANAVDGNPNTFWHTEYQAKKPDYPHEIVIELVPPSEIKGFAYLPRQDPSENGGIKDYEFYVSNDGMNFGEPIKKGEFKPGKEEKIEKFQPVKCRFIKLKALSEINGGPWAAAAEIRVIQIGEDDTMKNRWRSSTRPEVPRNFYPKSDAGAVPDFR
jgi:hypothetical protein